jgi:hypothetical protein
MDHLYKITPGFFVHLLCQIKMQHTTGEIVCDSNSALQRPVSALCNIFSSRFPQLPHLCEFVVCLHWASNAFCVSHNAVVSVCVAVCPFCDAIISLSVFCPTITPVITSPPSQRHLVLLHVSC